MSNLLVFLSYMRNKREINTHLTMKSVTVTDLSIRQVLVRVARKQVNKIGYLERSNKGKIIVSAGIKHHF